MRFPGPDFDDAVAAACHGTADDATLAALGEVLAADSSALDAYLRRVEIHAALLSLPHPGDIVGAADTAAAAPPPPPAMAPAPAAARAGGRSWPGPPLHGAGLGWWVAAAACVVAALAWWPRGGGDIVPAAPAGSGAAAPVTAMLVDEAAAVFMPPRSAGDVRFDPGDYELLSGAIHLRYVNGADLVIEGPARFGIRTALRTILQAGRVRAIVPPTALGFTVAAGDVAYEDVGTEFGLSVDAATGESRMLVFDGKVNLRGGDSAAALLRSVGEGDSVGFRDGRVQDSPPVTAGEFPAPGSIGRARWAAQRRQRAADPSLVAWFPFEPAADPSILANAAVRRDVPDGRIEGARWATGRWPGKQALLFDSDGDHVAIEIPGGHEELTVATWLKVDAFEREMTAILDSDGSADGGLHLQLNRLGLPRGGLLGVPRPEARWVGNPVPLGKWVHVVSVLSLPLRRHVIYVNGLPVMESGLAESDLLIRPGTCRVGSWLAGKPHPAGFSRSLRGIVDELSIWSRALSATEVRTLMESGRPSLLWSPENPPLGFPLPVP